MLRASMVISRNILKVSDLGFRFWGSRLGIPGLGFWVKGLSRVSGLGLRTGGLGCQV